MRSIVWRAIGALVLLGSAAAVAQPPGLPPQPPRTPRASAQVDVTGNWVAQVTEDWRWRMITPPKGDYASVPLNALGRQVADGWDPAKDVAAGEQCRAFGAGGLLRQPTRLRIAWNDDATLKVEADAGEQIRLWHFARNAPGEAAAGTWQGQSVAEWTGGPPPGAFPFPVAPNRGVAAARSGPTAGAAPAGPPGAAAAPPQRGGLKVVTTRLRAGYLRKNGVPYSDQAVVTEYFDRLSMFGNDYLQVVTVVVDPVYLTAPFVVSNQFKREPDASKWQPAPCATDAPLGQFQPPAFGL